MLGMRLTGCLRSISQCLVAVCLSLTGLSAPAAETVQSLRYGVTLYDFYQQNYFQALTELMIGQELEQLGPHTDNAELLRGGMSLSYGMDRQAETIFETYLSEPREAVDGDQAWFYLAKMGWQRGELPRAENALAKMSPEYEGQLQEEANYLRASISLREGREQEAATYLDRLSKDSPWLHYHYYNMGAAQAARGDWLGSIYYFRKFDDLRFRTEESKALRDKAYTASGFALMGAGHYEQAKADFTRVRLDSPMADRALLGYGWASSQMGDFQSALSPWQALSEHSMMSESVRESMLAVPYAYEQLGRTSFALANYQVASDLYAAELEGIEAAIDVFANGDLRSVLGLETEQAEEWLFGGDILPMGEHAPYLQHLITRHSFQASMRELRDLHSMAWHLGKARERLAVLSQVDTDQQANWALVIEGDRKSDLTQRQQTLNAQVNTLRERLAAAENDGRVLATEEQEQLWQRVQRAQALAEKLDVDSEKKLQLSIYQGLLIWDDNENYPARSWQLERQMQELEELTLTAEQSLYAVEDAVSQHQQSSFAGRIAAMQQRLDEQSVRVDIAMGASEKQIRQVAIVELQQQGRALSRALGQSKLAVARLFDLGSPEVPR